FSSRRRHTRSDRDWSSDVCSSDLAGTYSTQGYDAAHLLIDGVLKGNDTRAKLLDYVEGLKSYDGVAGTIDFQANGNSSSKDIYIYEVKSGKLTELGTVSKLVH